MTRQYEPPAETKASDVLVEIPESKKAELYVSTWTYWTRQFSAIAQYKNNLFNWADWACVSSAIILGTLSVWPYFRPTNELFDDGQFPEELRIPELFGTLSLNDLLGIYSVLSFLNFERLLNSPFIKKVGVVFKGLSKKEHSQRLIASAVSASPIAMLSYDAKKSVLYNCVMPLVQTSIGITLMFIGISAVADMVNYLKSKCNRGREDEFQATANKILDDLALQRENLKELLVSSECDPKTSLPSIQTMLTKMRTIKNKKNLDTESYSEDIIRAAYTEPLLHQPRNKGISNKILVPVLGLTLCGITLAGAGGYLWDSEKGFMGLFHSAILAWTLSSIGNFAFTCVGLKFSWEVGQAIMEALYNFFKNPIVPYTDNPGFASRFVRSLKRALPYAMAQFLKTSISLLFYLFILANLSSAASLDLQNNFALELATFMLLHKVLWLVLVHIGTVIFNFFGCPYLINSAEALVILATANDKSYIAEGLLLLNTLDRQIQEFEYLAPQQLVGIFRELFSLKQFSREEDRRDFIKENAETPIIKFLLSIFSDSHSYSTGYHAFGSGDELSASPYSIYAKNHIHQVLKAKVEEIEQVNKYAASSWRDCLPSLFGSKKPSSDDSLQTGLLSAEEGHYKIL